jgi:hypothetical protein
MNIEEAFPSKYLKASDLKGQRVTVKMDRVETETMGDDHKVILYFQGKEKGLVLNVTNKNMIVDLYGYETEDWVGQPIVLYEAMVQFRDKMVPALRVMKPPARRPQHQPGSFVDRKISGGGTIVDSVAPVKGGSMKDQLPEDEIPF